MPRQQRFALLLILSSTFVGGCFSRSEITGNVSGTTPLQIDQLIRSVKTDDLGKLIEVNFRDVAATNDDLKMLA